MWRNYVTVGLRSLTKNRAYAAINILGLAIGMAACLMILLFVRYERSYDRWLPNVEDTYQLQTWWPHPSSGEPGFLQMASYVTKERMQKDFPQIERAVYALGGTPVFAKDGQVAPAEDYIAVNDDFLAVVDLPLLKGSRDALSRNDTAVLTQSEAIKRFGSDDVIGKTMTLIQKGKYHDYRINGILKDLPKNSHMKIAAIVRRDFPTYFATEPQFLTCWGCQSGWVYLKLKHGTDPKAIEAGLPAWEKRNIPDENESGIRFNQGDDTEWHLVGLKDIHLGKAQDGTMTPGNDQRTIATFAVIALLILSMAVVNFINLATARASQRAREVALRKVLGASRRQLVVQFLGESLLVSAAAMLVAVAFVELLVRPFAAFLNADLTFSYLGSDGLLLPVIGLVLMVGILGGLYPAFFLSRFKPAQVLKANRSAAESPGSGRLRTALVIGQFAVSIGLIICTAVVYGQTVYARSVDPGFRRDHILQVDNMSRYQLMDKGEQFVARMKRIEGVTAVGLTDIGVNTSNQNNTGIVMPGNPKQITLGNYKVDRGFFDAMGLKLVAGRWFDQRAADDSTTPFPENEQLERVVASRGINIVLNEKGARTLGFHSPDEAVGKTFKTIYFGKEVGLVPLTVIGVVKDSRFRSVRTPLDDLMFVNYRTGLATMVIRYEGDPAVMRAKIEAAWRSQISDVPFEAKFSEDIIGDLYKAEYARAKIFAAFAGLAVIVGCLGLFGLAAFTAERRTKEIGIRKVLGARTSDIVKLLVWQFSRPVVIANLIAWPIAWWVMRDWLNGFDARIALSPVPFLVAGLLALVIAILTVGGHALRVARASPIHALRYE
ncbi:MAG: ABC transporter permease [Sphingomicrobium sp.]|nr:ABC transporter permease [Sphingomonadales bacterium]